MPKDVERFIRIERPTKPSGWHTIPLGAKVRIWEMLTSEAEGDLGPEQTKWWHFHIRYLAGVARGQRITYLGHLFKVVEVSDSKRLIGLELRCSPVAD